VQPRALRLTATFVALASFGFLVAIWIAFPWVAGDTPFVLDGSNAFLTCLSNHDYDACGFTGKLNYWGLMSPIGDWPLLQHVPDLISIKLGANGHPARTRILESLSVAGVAGSVALARVVLSRIGQAAWFWGFLLIVLSSPLVWYARTTAAEALAAGLLVCLVAAAVLRAPPPVLALAALGASWTKETSYPFVAALGFLGLDLARRRTGLPIRRHVVWGAGGIAVAFVAASLFNVVRFGSILSPNLFEEELHTPGILRPLEYTVALFVSPSGGIFVFWPAASVLVLAACLVPFWSRSRGATNARPALIIVVVVLGLAYGFAGWWTPFGWAGYGPRFSLPWVLPLVLVALVAYGEALAGLARRALVPSWRLLLVFAAVLTFSLPSIGHMWRPDATARFFAQPQPDCDAPWRPGWNLARWNDCQHEQLWLDRPMPLYALDSFGTSSSVLTSVVVALGLLSCLILLREELPKVRPVAGRVSPAEPQPRRKQADAGEPAVTGRPRPRLEASSEPGRDASRPPSRPPPSRNW